MSEVKNLKVKLFTHTDLDGVGCAVLMLYVVKDVDVTYCNYHDIDKTISDFIDSKADENYDRIYITDIYVNEETAKKIDQAIWDKVYLLDHHKTAEWLNQYSWAKVLVEDDHSKKSGTTLLLGHMIEEGWIDPLEHWDHLALSVFATHVGWYDTWQWVSEEVDEPKKLNDLLHIIGRDRFVERYSQMIEPLFTDTEELLLQIEQERINYYIEKKAKEMIRAKIREYNIGIVFAEQYISQLGNELAKANDDLDFVCIINFPKSVSYRGVKDHIHLGEVAKLFGGGGHQKAAGSPLNQEILASVIGLVFN